MTLYRTTRSPSGDASEIKGQIGDAMIKKTAAERWCRAVTNDGRFGNWSYSLCFGPAELRTKLDAEPTTPSS